MIWHLLDTQDFCSLSPIPPRNIDPFHIVSYNIKWVETFWTYINLLQVLSDHPQPRVRFISLSRTDPAHPRPDPQPCCKTQNCWRIICRLQITAVTTKIGQISCLTLSRSKHFSSHLETIKKATLTKEGKSVFE